MKQANLNATKISPAHQAAEPRTPHVDLTRSELSQPDPVRLDPAHLDSVRPEPISSDPNYDSQREQSDRNRRRADPEFQDGSYGFESRDERMDIDMEDRRGTWRAGREENGRARDGRIQNDRRLYSDNLYSRPRGRGFR